MKPDDLEAHLKRINDRTMAEVRQLVALARIEDGLTLDPLSPEMKVPISWHDAYGWERQADYLMEIGAWIKDQLHGLGPLSLLHHDVRQTWTYRVQRLLGHVPEEIG